MHKQGKVVFVNLYYRNSKTREKLSKFRPALIISNNVYNLENNSVVVCSITKVIRNWKYSIFLNKKSFIEGSLPLVSELRTDMIYNVHKSEISKVFGMVNKKVLEKAIFNICKILNNTSNSISQQIL